MSIEYAADRAVGPGGGPQNAPLLGEGGPASLFPNGVGNGERERASSSQLQKGVPRERRMRVSLVSPGGDTCDGAFEVVGPSGCISFLSTGADDTHDYTLCEGTTREKRTLTHCGPSGSRVPSHGTRGWIAAGDGGVRATSRARGRGI